MLQQAGIGPEAFLMAAAGGITQAENTPKEWRGGAKAYGGRAGNSFAIHLIRTSLQHGASTALHEDDRYIPSTESGFFRRTGHAISSVFIAHNDTGGERFAFSCIGRAAGASFISRAGEPRSTPSSGDGAVTFGIGMATDAGFNFLREFGPKRFKSGRRCRAARRMPLALCGASREQFRLPIGCGARVAANGLPTAFRVHKPSALVNYRTRAKFYFRHFCIIHNSFTVFSRLGPDAAPILGREA